MKKFLNDEQGLLKDIRDDVVLFMSAELDDVGGTIRFSNNVDFDPSILYGNGEKLEEIIETYEKVRERNGS